MVQCAGDDDARGICLQALMDGSAFCLQCVNNAFVAVDRVLDDTLPFSIAARPAVSAFFAQTSLSLNLHMDFRM